MKSLISAATFALLLSTVALAPKAIAAPANKTHDVIGSRRRALNLKSRYHHSMPEKSAQAKAQAKSQRARLLNSTGRLRSLRLAQQAAATAVKPQAATPGQIGFRSALRLNSFTTNSEVSGLPATYRVKLMLPANAGRSLQAVKIMQDVNVDTVRFDPSETQVSLSSGAKTPLASVGGVEQPGTATVVFNPPIAPGETVTVDLPVRANPSDGIYLFGVTAFPEGENTLGQFLGFGRLHLNDR
ncbi:DUF2808 domain-containing protein [filamentous cyanobacterium LEGE 11480]|uniref:DUF2808 domain-containing protein n=1 Tax=Romeriopsis navalis LEGE 11480 TaxID=2777977 RepID=A0A928Z2B3_9CYAN|nr:DUF2808 domain-containing protein [Romeriopsis navalis]MBE9028220.1 DUF2808 domain-containing protein [Romeriopsis navalis LEGE 11480]